MTTDTSSGVIIQRAHPRGRGAADDVIDGLLDRERARLDKLCPVVQSEEILERLLRLLADRDEIHELPIILGRQANSLVMRNSPHRGRIDGTTQVDVQFGEFIPERVRHYRRRLAEVTNKDGRRACGRGWHGRAACARAAGAPGTRLAE